MVNNKLLIRLKLILLFFFALFLVLIARTVTIQFIQSEKFLSIANAQHFSKLILRASRGKIYDRNGELLVASVNSKSFAFDPSVARKDSNYVTIIKFIAKSLNINENTLIESGKANSSFVWIKRGMFSSPAVLDTFGVPWLIRVSEPKRIHFFGKTTQSVVGFTNIDNRGMYGIEKHMDSLLSGTEGFAILKRDAHGRLIPDPSLVINKPIDGKDLHLTIDITFQNIVSYYLEEGFRRSGASRASAILLEPSTGEVLALSSLPNFDPNEFANFTADGSINSAINISYEPGSVIKPIILAMALESNLIETNETFQGFNGNLDFGDVKIRDEHPLGEATIEEAMAFSSNIIFSQIAMRFEPEQFINQLKNFGFGGKTNIELTGEIRGYLPSVNNLNKNLLPFMGFGYGFKVTPIQIAQAFSAIANDGYLAKPHLIRSIQDNTIAYSQQKQRIISKETAEYVKNTMIKVIEYGTGKKAKINNIKIAGKTGTARIFRDTTYSTQHYVNFFVGFFPAEKPKFLLLVMLENPQSSIYASETVVPIFRKIALSILHCKNIANYIK